MTQKMNIATLRKIRKELMERADRAYRNDPNFDGRKVAEAINAKFAKELRAVGKIPVNQLFTLTFGSYHNRLTFTDVPEDKLPARLVTLKKAMTEAYQAAEQRHNEASERHRFTQLAERVSALEVEILLGGLTTNDPKVQALLDEIRLALQ